MGRKLFTCPCCGYKTLSELNSWEICVVCRWEDDPLQSDEPDFAGGANVESLREAQKNWKEIGVYSKNLLDEKNDIAAWRFEKDRGFRPLE
ncbi:CPCC family cysteine-rich protein [Niallia taxi]|uniref:CPCC family cysteine-rich protein n=1 Tax=Niallia taxi TaxID=2499688 RepID=UPI00255032A0|nr:CPCC family cysteine-rich protein [Niallia taxi]MDK8641279.1 CPCC family cysteine-rich protein [Niallia taxi]